MREVFILGAGWCACGRQGGLSPCIGKQAGVDPGPEQPGPLRGQNLADWHRANAEVWRAKAKRDARVLTSPVWKKLVEASADRETSADSGPDPTVYYAAVAGACSEPIGTLPIGSHSKQAEDSPRRAILIGSSKGPFVQWLDRLDRIRQGGTTSRSGPFLPEFDGLNQLVLRSRTFGRSPALTFLNCPVSACSTGLRAVNDACRLIAWDHADHCLAGAADASIHPLTLAAYTHMGLLSPRGVCEPWSPDADGFFLGEGAGMLQVSSEKPVDQTPNSSPWRVASWSSACDPGITSGDPTGQVLRDILTRLLAKAGWTPQEVTAIKPHATGTPVGDAAEQSAVQTIWPDRSGLRILLPKRQFGHCLGATGVLELAWALQELSTSPISDACSTASHSHSGHPLHTGRSRGPDSIRHRLIAWSLGFGGGVEAVALEQIPAR